MSSLRKTRSWSALRLAFALSIIIGLSAILQPSRAEALVCRDLFAPSQVGKRLETGSRLDQKQTKIEAELSRPRPKLAADDQLLLEIEALRLESPEMANRARLAREDKLKNRTLLLDVTPLPAHMQLFLNGSYKRIIGSRGLSRPFVNIRADGENALIIQMEGDLYPLLIKWNEEISTPQLAKPAPHNDKIHQTLELPINMKSKQDMASLPAKYIHSLISGSGLNRYIPSSSSRVMRMNSLLHDGKLSFDRPTQVESKEVTGLLNTDVSLRSRVRSLLFVAPTASGKTRVLGDRIINKVQVARLNSSSPGDKKLTILMTKTPDLTSELAKGIGDQVISEVGSSNVRIIQWGGKFSEEQTLPELLKFIDSAKLPVVLVTSYPTVAARAKTSAEKAELLARANGLMIDEAHNAGGRTFEEMMSMAHEQASRDRANGNSLKALDIFGVTASPITRIQRTVELFDHAFWAGIDSPKRWANQVVSGKAMKPSDSVLEWVRVMKQYNIARDRGEISAADPLFYKPEERGFSFASIFKRADVGTHANVSIDRLKEIWPDVSKIIEGHGPGVIHTYPRDAEVVSDTLSKLTGKNYVSLQKMGPEERTAVYEAFRNETEYRGRKVDAIVGTIREGLDFPRAGWYLSFKKYVRFPENVQGPGRVVRIALNKPPPVIIFFGDEINKIAYSNVRELVLSRLGKLPPSLKEQRLYSGSRRLNTTQPIANAIDDLNVSIEAMVRIREDVSKSLGARGELNPQTILEMQNILRDIRASGRNREISEAMKTLVAEVNSFPFFHGTLKETWTYTDRLINQSRKGEGALINRNFTEADIRILKDPKLMEDVKLFRSLYAAIGIVPRSIISEIELRPMNVTETARAVNAFVARNGVEPYSAFESAHSLKAMVDLGISGSPRGLWMGLDVRSRQLLATRISARDQLSFESVLENYLKSYGDLPKPGYELIGNNQATAVERIGARLAEELELRLRDGTLDLSQMSPELRASLDRSTVLEGMVTELAATIVKFKSEETVLNSYIQQLKAERILTYENLMVTGEFKVLKTVKDLSEMSGRNETRSRSYRKMIEELLAE